MNRITQEARKRQAVVKLASRKGKRYAAEKYGVSLSSVKRWCKRYDGTWQSLKERSHRPKHHPRQHTAQEETLIRESMRQSFFRYGWDGAYTSAREAGYTRSYSGFIYAARRMGLSGGMAEKCSPRKHDRRYPELSVPGEKVQIDVKEVPYCCLKGAAKRDGKHLYQWTAIDECTRVRFVYGFIYITTQITAKYSSWAALRRPITNARRHTPLYPAKLGLTPIWTISPSRITRHLFMKQIALKNKGGKVLYFSGQLYFEA